MIDTYIPPQPSQMDTMLAHMMDTSTATMQFSTAGGVKEHIPDINTRRRIQNRNAQRTFRARQRKAKSLQLGQPEQTEQQQKQQLPLEISTTMPSYTDTDWLSQLCVGTETLPTSLPQSTTSQPYACPSTDLHSTWDATTRPSLHNRQDSSSSSSSLSQSSPSQKARTGVTTALHIAVENDHGNLVQLLLAHEPQQYSVQDARGRTALHIAAQKGSRDIISKLLSMETESKLPNSDQSTETRTLDLQDINGQTALFIATDRGQGGIVQELLGFGANPDIGDCFGKRPLAVATLRGDRVLVQLLLEGQADTYLDLS